MIQLPRAKAAFLAPVLLLAFAACDGSSAVGDASINGGRLGLVQVSYGRLVDIYAYQRIDEARGDRRDAFNRRRVLVQKDVVVNPAIETQPLYDAAGEEVETADYRFLPFDIATGHEELMILWDNRGAEADRFQAALDNARRNLPELVAAYRGQNTANRPIPVVPRNAAYVLTFTGPVGVNSEFFRINQAALQVLEFKGDPNLVSPVDAFRAIPFRAIVDGRQIVVDPTILGGEATGGFTSKGLPPSTDQVTANIRLAIPSRGSVSRAFFVNQDEIAELNGPDSFGRDSVVRDFRSGNQLDGLAGVLRDLEPPMLVGNLSMGITNVDPDGVITLDKRLHQVPVRGRFPFVEGALSASTGFPLGPVSVPTTTPLRQGDYLTQVVPVQMPGGLVEEVSIRAEILQNLEIGTVRNDPAFPGTGLAADGTQGAALPVVRVRVGTIRGADSLGRPVGFVADPQGSGADCSLRTLYYERVPFVSGGLEVSDAARRLAFLRIEPRPPATVGGLPVPPGTRIAPNASLSLEFSEPIDFETADYSTNFVIGSSALPGQMPNGDTFADLIRQPKVATAGVVPARLTDQSGDGTVLQLQPPMGFFHRNGQTETYHLHLLLDQLGIRDLAGNTVLIFSDPAQNVRNWSVSFTLDQAAAHNLVGWHFYRFEDADEDGTPPGSVDIFGQFRLLNGRLVGADAVRFSRTADVVNLAPISRILRGECWDADGDVQVFPAPPLPGTLYWQPQMIDTVAPPNVPQVFRDYQSVPQPVGHVIEPHQPRGSRMMMRYIEDDFSLSYRQASEMVIDIEQLYWSPFNNLDVLFDVFDRYSMLLSHTDRRPDIHYLLVDGECLLACPGISSSLSTTFLDNVLPGSQQVPVFEDRVYRMNPNDSFRSPNNFKYIAYPRFDRSYTWRDSRLVSVDANGDVIGLGGARDPGAPTPNDDWTANIDSPWIEDDPDPEFPGTTWVIDEADFRGDRERDHDPIALPLLVDFKMFPDSTANGLALGSNGFQMAMISQPSNFLLGTPGGYYSLIGVGCPGRDPWPMTRVHTTGGLDPNTNTDVLVNPATTQVATGGWIKDAGAIVITNIGVAGNGPLGIFRAPPGDAMINWAQADFVRKVSTATFGFLDTLQPNRGTAGAGVPDFLGIANEIGVVRILDVVSLLDPPQSDQPAGTSIVLEFRGAQNFVNDDVLYDPVTNDTVPPPEPTGPPPSRGNLLNPNYACEAYRYSLPNSGAGFDLPRIEATGLTPYVTEDRLAEIRVPGTGRLPRFLNVRLVMTNNVEVSPALSPSLRSMAVVYLMSGVPQ